MSNPENQFRRVCNRAREAMKMQTIADVLQWDERTGMPVRGGDYRAGQISMLSGLVHQKRTDPQYGEDLQQLAEAYADRDPASDEAATVRELHRDWSRDRKLPTDLVQRISEATVRGQQAWDAARKANNYGSFRPALETIIKLKREAGQRLAEDTDQSTYEALLDEYEPGASAEQLQDSFESLRKPLVALIAQIKAAPRQPDTSILRRDFPIDRQRHFSRWIAERIGFDFTRGRLDETSHPFCTTLGPGDVRILTRFDSHWLPGGLFGTLHEAGHGIYEQGLRSDWFGLPPGSYVSLGMHESQSRLWENQIGRSRPFWDGMYGTLQSALSPQLDDVSVEAFHFAVNAIGPSLIRVEADEATYNLHIIIRFDLERQLIEGSLGVEDLPEAWNDRYEQDLGIRPPADAVGVLQDVHWSAGLIGYFPTYTLGNLAAAQLFEAAVNDLGDWQTMIAQADFRPLMEWLSQHVHRHGRCYSGAELVQRASGSPLSADALVGQLRAKLMPLYGLSSPGFS